MDRPDRHTLAALRGVKRRLARQRHRLGPLAHRAGRFIANSSLPAAMLAASLLLARYMPNSDFSYPSEIILPIVLFAIAASLIFYIYRWSFRGRPFPAQVASLLLVYALYGFNYAFAYVQKWTDAILPSSLTTSFSSAASRILLLAVLFWIVAWLINRLVRHVKPLQHLQLYKILVFVVCFVFVVQLGKVSVRVWTIRHQLAYHYSTKLPAKPAQTAKNPAAEQTNGKPNIYYLLFDRYASADTLNNVYHFDNSDMLGFLKDEGFVTRQPAYANYPFTQQSVASTLSMGYLSDLETRFKHDAGSFQTAFPYRDIISDPPVAETLKQNGYNYNQVSSWWDFTRVGVKADDDPVKSFRLRVLGLDFWLTDLQRDIMNKSAFGPLLQKGITLGRTPILKFDRDRNPRDNFHDQLTALQAIAANSPNQTKPQFSFAHILSPHDPYLFAADGSDAPYNGDRTDQDVDEYVKYANQLTYANTQIKQLIATIRSKDPAAVVIFQADEGPYPKQFRGSLSAERYFDPKNLDDADLHQKLGIMASYYMPGVNPATVSRQLDSSVNAFPFVLNNYLGYDITYLPDCNFSSGNKYVLYDYTLMTGRLRHTSDPADCKQFDR